MTAVVRRAAGIRLEGCSRWVALSHDSLSSCSDEGFVLRGAAAGSCQNHGMAGYWAMLCARLMVVMFRTTTPAMFPLCGCGGERGRSGLARSCMPRCVLISGHTVQDCTSIFMSLHAGLDRAAVV